MLRMKRHKYIRIVLICFAIQQMSVETERALSVMTVVKTRTSPLSICEDVASINQSINADTWNFRKISSIPNAHVREMIYSVNFSFRNM